MPTKNFDTLFDRMAADPARAAIIDEEMAKMAVGVQLNEARSQAGLSLDGLAEKSGVAKTTIIRIEHGTASPSIATLQKLANAMGKRFQTAFA